MGQRRRDNAGARSLEIRLSNYKQMHAGTAEAMGVSIEFKLARTLTAARKILWGVKKGMTR